MPYTSENPKPKGSYTKLKKPKDLPKAPVVRLTASDMFNPSLATKNDIVPRMPSNDNLAVDPRFAGMVNPTAGPGTGGAPGMMAASGGTPEAIGSAGSGGVGTAGNSGGYTPTAITSGYLNDNPDVIAADVLAGMGITNPEVIDMLAEVTGDYGLAMQLLLQGSTPGDFGLSGPESTDAIVGFAQNMMTPGGSLPDIDQLMGLILNADPNSALGAYLATGGPDAVNNLITVAARMGTSNPYFTAGLEQQMRQMDLGYRQGIAHGTISDPDAYYQSVRTGPLAGYFR